VYATAYNFKGKTYSVLINGQNGKIAGQYPKSPLKIALIIIIIAGIIGGIFAAKSCGGDNKNDDLGYNVATEAYMDAYEYDIEDYNI